MNYELYAEHLPALMWWDESYGKFISIPVMVILKDGTLRLATCEQYPEDELHIWYSHDSERWVLSGQIEHWGHLNSTFYTEKVRERYGIYL